MDKQIDLKIKQIAVTVAALNHALTQMYDAVELMAQTQWDLYATLCAQFEEFKDLNYKGDDHNDA